MATEDARKLFMAGLPDSVTEEVLRGLFNETSAQVTELTLPRDRATGRPRGFAFVRLGSEADADRARQELDGRIVDGKMISVRPFHADPPPGGVPRTDGPRPPGVGGPGAGPGGPSGPGGPGGFAPRGGGGGQGSPDRTLYVGNLPYDATQEEVETLLRNLGAEGVARVYLPLDQDGRKRGFGFVSMATPDAANFAIEALKVADLRGRKLIVNIAHPKGERPARPEGGGPGGFSGGPPGGGGGGGGGFGGPPRAFAPGPGGGSGFGPPAPPGGRSAKGEGRKRKFDEGGGGGAAGGPGKKKDDRDDNWKDREDDDW
ncbi:MAG: RNA-binding protein [Deltaproteobacteria bacterium]